MSPAALSNVAGDRWVDEHGDHGAEPATRPQLAVIRDLGGDPSVIWNKRQAAEAIDVLRLGPLEDMLAQGENSAKSAGGVQPRERMGGNRGPGLGGPCWHGSFRGEHFSLIVRPRHTVVSALRNVMFSLLCAVERRAFLVGANPTQQLSLRLVAARAVHGGNDMD